MVAALLRLPRRMPHHARGETRPPTGDPTTAERLYGFSVVNRLVAPRTALDEARKALAWRIMEGGPLALAATKRILVEL